MPIFLSRYKERTFACYNLIIEISRSVDKQYSSLFCGMLEDQIVAVVDDPASHLLQSISCDTWRWRTPGASHRSSIQSESQSRVGDTDQALTLCCNLIFWRWTLLVDTSVLTTVSWTAMQIFDMICLGTFFYRRSRSFLHLKQNILCGSVARF